VNRRLAGFVGSSGPQSPASDQKPPDRRDLIVWHNQTHLNRPFHATAVGVSLQGREKKVRN
jgi:hypothetical protein